jgi:hypothetical protein
MGYLATFQFHFIFVRLEVSHELFLVSIQMMSKGSGLDRLYEFCLSSIKKISFWHHVFVLLVLPDALDQSDFDF